jgi:arylsulfatase A-like enzyme
MSLMQHSAAKPQPKERGQPCPRVRNVLKRCADKAVRAPMRMFAVVLAVVAPPFISCAQDSTNSPPPAPRRPSIILIVSDDLGYGEVGCYGQTKIKTPNLDRMAAEGIRFTSFYAGSSVCSPSRAALVQGLHTGHLNIRGNTRDAVLQPDELTITEVLKQAGYHTGLIGKWGLSREGMSGSPQSKGFDEFAGYLDNEHAHDYYPDYIWRYDPPRIPGESGWNGKLFLSQNANGAKGKYLPDLCTEAALNFLRINKPDQFNNYRPFFLMLSYTIPHANNEEGRRITNGMQVPSDAPYSDEQWPQVEKNKAAMISRLDGYVGKLLDKLRELKIENNTVVFFMSDNGPHAEGSVDPKFFNSSGPLRGIKRDLYEGGVRVPMIARWPGRIKPGQTSDFAWANWDFPATAADIGRTQWPTNTDSLSVYPLLLGRGQTNKHEFLYWEFHERGFQQAARMGDWKAVRPQAGEKLELYDLKSDLGEKQNMADKHPDVIEKFEAYFKTARIESEKWPVKKPEETPAQKIDKPQSPE